MGASEYFGELPPDEDEDSLDDYLYLVNLTRNAPDARLRDRNHMGAHRLPDYYVSDPAWYPMARRSLRELARELGIIQAGVVPMIPENAQARALEIVSEINRLCGRRIVIPARLAGRIGVAYCQRCGSPRATTDLINSECSGCVSRRVRATLSVYEAAADSDTHYALGNYVASPEPGAKAASPTVGYELEVEVPETKKRGPIALRVLEVMGGGPPQDTNPGYFQSGTDGSLTHGIEFRSRIATLPFHAGLIREKLNEAFKGTGCRSHDVTTCGLHVNIGIRRANGNTYLSEEECAEIQNFLASFSDGQCLKLFRRNPNRYALRKGTGYGKESIDPSKYQLAAIHGGTRVEFRGWRGTLEPGSLIAALDISVQICEYIKSAPKRPLSNVSFNDFFWRVRQNKATLPETIAYLDERDIKGRRETRKAPIIAAPKAKPKTAGIAELDAARHIVSSWPTAEIAYADLIRGFSFTDIRIANDRPTPMTQATDNPGNPEEQE